MVRIRLKKTGTRNASCFRIVVIEKRASRDGRAIEELGYYNPRNKIESINVDRYNYWVGVGAVPSETVGDIYDRAVTGVNLADRPRKATLSRKAQAKAAEEAKAAAAAAEAAAAAAAAAEEAPAEA